MAFPLMWIAEALTPAAATTPVAPVDTSNPITVAYSWAQLLALLTDRALWLFFLGIILGLSWYLDRKKEKMLARKEAEIQAMIEWQKKQIESLAVTIHDSTDCMEHVKHVLERLERKL